MLANPDAPVPFNIAESYQSSGPSYAAFVDIVFDDDDAGFVVERPRGNRSGPHLEEGNPYGKNQPYLYPSCGYYWDTYHPEWLPIDYIDGKCYTKELPCARGTMTEQVMYRVVVLYS